MLHTELRFQALAKERNTMQIVAVPGGGDDMIGLEIEYASILRGHLQGGAAAADLGFPHRMTEEDLHPPGNPIFQPPRSGRTKHRMHSIDANPQWQVTKQHGGVAVDPGLQPSPQTRIRAAQTLVERPACHSWCLVPGK